MVQTAEEKKKKAQERMQKLRASQKKDETPQEKADRLEHQRVERQANRDKKRVDENKPPARTKAKPKSRQDYKISTTLAQNIDRVIRLKKELGGSGDDLEDVEILEDVTKVMKYLYDKYSNLNTIKSYVSSVIAVFRDIGDLEHPETEKALVLYGDIIKDLKKKIDGVVDKNQKTKDESERWVPWKDIMKVKSINIENHIDRLIFLLYVQNPPRRAEYRTLMVTDASPKHLKTMTKENYVVITKAGNISRIILNDYKTVKSYGQYIIPLTKASPLKHDLKKFIEMNKLKPGEYLFPPMLRHSSGWSSAVTDTFNKIFGKKMSINLLRKSYMSYINELPPAQRSQEKLKQVAVEMGTSLEQLASSYTKVNEDSDSEEDENEKIYHF